MRKRRRKQKLIMWMMTASKANRNRKDPKCTRAQRARQRSRKNLICLPTSRSTARRASRANNAIVPSPGERTLLNTCSRTKPSPPSSASSARPRSKTKPTCVDTRKMSTSG
uniref:(northern house mosquito) hypothetical protein n=1 Tax=Culex pipiens TaxID=7175 RepID=A0A8D8MAG1_CULPI